MTLWAVLQFEFMRNALEAAFLTSCLCAVIGTLVVANRLVALSGGIAHAAYGGVGLSLFMGANLLLCTTSFTVVMALIMATVTLRIPKRADAIIGVIWAAGMATGVILMDLSPGYAGDLGSYLFGSILAVSRQDLGAMLLLLLVVVAVVKFKYQELLAISFDSEFARSRGLPVSRLYILLILLAALSIVLVIRVVGLILVIALLSISPTLAEPHSRSLKGMMIRSLALNLFFCFSGLFLAYRYNLTSGAAIILVATATFLLEMFAERLRLRSRHPNRG